MNKKLDLENVKVYTENDVVDAMRLIGQDVYMSDDEKFENYYKFRLIGVKVIENESYPFLGYDGYDGGGRGRESYKYFILEKDAKFMEEKEKKLRPFKTLDEFFDKFDFNIGETVTIKRTNCESENEYEETILFIGFRCHKYIDSKDSKNTAIILGSNSYTFEELMNNYRYYKDGRWHSFGIEE